MNKLWILINWHVYISIEKNREKKIHNFLIKFKPLYKFWKKKNYSELKAIGLQAIASYLKPFVGIWKQCIFQEKVQTSFKLP